MAEEIKDETKEENVESENQEVEFEIEDDMPEEDRKVLDKDKETSNEKQKTESEGQNSDELDKYSESVQKRINKLKREYHDERRAKESKEREAIEAFRYAEALKKENEKLKKNLSTGEDTLIKEAQDKAELALSESKARFKKAYEDNDPEAMAEAQASISNATALKHKWESYTPQYKMKESTLQTQQNQYNQGNGQNVPAPDPKHVQLTQDWVAKNTWFGSDSIMTGTAQGLHQDAVDTKKLVSGSEEYWAYIDQNMRNLFPDKFEDVSVEEKEGDSDLIEQAPKTKITPNNVVAPVKRNPSSKKITLTATQVSLAKRLGVPLEEYAKQVAQLNR